MIEYGWIIIMFHNGEVQLCGKQIHASRSVAVAFAKMHGDIDHLQFIRIKKPSTR